MNKYIIQYSLFGSNPRYYDALRKNISFIESDYSKLFITSIILGKGVPGKWIDYLSKTSAKIIMHDIDLLTNIHQDFYRIYPLLSGEGNGFFCRDADSLLNKNEMDSMMRFIDSDYSFHIVRDHPNHLAPIMGGIYGVKAYKYELVKHSILTNLYKYKFSDKSWRNYNSGARGDQEILADYVYPLIYKDAYIESNYTIFFNEKSMIAKCDIPKTKNTFIGQIDPKYNTDAKRDKKDYLNGKRRVYLPYWIIKLFRYKYIYRIYWVSSKLGWSK